MQPTKRQLKSRRAIPSYVTRSTAAAELEISLPTFYDWVRRGILPPPAAGFPRSSPRWRWSLIERWMSGDRTDRPAEQNELFGKQRGPKRGAPNAGRPRKPVEYPATAEFPRTMTIDEARSELEAFELPDGEILKP